MTRSTAIWVKAGLTLLLPVLVFLAGSWAVVTISGRPAMTATSVKPLGMRFGYDTRAVDAYWKSLNIEGRGAERRFLELDLVFPFLYGGVFAAALLAAWIQLGRPCDPVWVVLPVIVTVVADWTENLVQLGQLGRYQPDAATLDPGWIQAASIATMLKLVFGAVSGLLLVALVVGWIANSPRGT